MADVYLVLDESGAKGFAKNTEAFDGELGVIAGYFVRGNLVERVRHEFDKIRTGFSVEGDAKIHLTDLDAPQQHSVRSAVYNYLLDRELSLIYEAAYVQGLHESTKRSNEISHHAHEERRSDIRVPYKPDNDRLLAVIFQMIFGKAAAYAVDHFGKDVTLHVILDRTDQPILDEFRKKADEFLNAGKPKQRELRGYDIVRKTPVTEYATIRVEGPDVDKAMGDFSGVKYELSCEDSGLTFVADVVANSLHYHLKQSAARTQGIDLNSKKAVDGYKLQHQFYGMSDGTTFTSLTDIMYGHPDRTR